MVRGEETSSSETDSDETEEVNYVGGDLTLTSPYQSFASAGSTTFTGTCTNGATITASGDIASEVTVTCTNGVYSLDVVLSGSDGPKSVTITRLGSSPATSTLTVRKSSCAVSGGFMGSGTDPDPYMVCSLEQLDGIRNDVTAVYKLGDDIYAGALQTWNEGQGFEPIAAFTGKLLGNGKTIYDFYINRPTSDSIGLFANFPAASGVTVQNLNFVDAEIHGNGTVGTLVGESREDTNVIANVSITGTLACAAGDCGGLVGLFDGGSLSGSHFSGSVSGLYQTGGLIGTLWSGSASVTVSSSSTSGTFGDACIGRCGGLIGSLDGGLDNVLVEKSFSSMNVNAPAGGYVGGLIGYVDGSFGAGPTFAIENVYTIGNVTGDIGVGGIIGFMWGKNDGPAFTNLTNCYATGDVEAATTMAGGIIGQIDLAFETPKMQNCFAVGSVTSAGIEGAIAGESDNAVWTNNFYYNHAGNPAACAGNIAAGTAPCSVTVDVTDFYNSGNAPLSSWTFPGTWVTTATFPKLAWE